MSGTPISAEEFIASNPLPPTPNPLVNETLAQLRVSFWLIWLGKTMGAMLHCAAALDRCAKQKRGALFTRQWESWQKALMDEIELFFHTLFYIGRANVDCALPDPASWAFESLYRLIRESFVWPVTRQHVVDEWIRIACHRGPVRIWEAPVGAGFYGVSSSNEQIRDSDMIIPVLRISFEQMTLQHLLDLSNSARLQLAYEGWRRPVREDKPIVTIRDLIGLAPRDRRRHGFIYAIYPQLKQEILDVRSIVHQEAISISIETIRQRFIETIRQNFFHLREVNDDLIQKSVLGDPKTISEATAAIDIICAYDQHVTRGTVERNTRSVPNASDVFSQANSHSEQVSGHPSRLLRLLRPELLPYYEELPIARNRRAKARNKVPLSRKSLLN